MMEEATNTLPGKSVIEAPALAGTVTLVDTTEAPAKEASRAGVNARFALSASKYNWSVGVTPTEELKLPPTPAVSAVKRISEVSLAPAFIAAVTTVFTLPAEFIAVINPSLISDTVESPCLRCVCNFTSLNSYREHVPSVKFLRNCDFLLFLLPVAASSAASATNVSLSGLTSIELKDHFLLPRL